MTSFCRKTVGPGAESLANRGKRTLDRVDQLPAFFGNPVLDEAFKNALGNRVRVLPDGARLVMKRGPINRVEADVPNIPPPNEPLVNRYVAIDAYTVETTVLHKGEYVATAKTRVGILISHITDLQSWRLVVGTFGAHAPTDVDVNPSVPIGTGYEEIVPKNKTSRDAVFTGITPELYNKIDYGTYFTEEKWPMQCTMPNCYGTYKWMNGAVEIIPANGKVYFATLTWVDHGTYFEWWVNGTLTASGFHEEVSGAYVSADDYGFLCLKTSCVIPFAAYENGLTPGPTAGGYYPNAPSATTVSYAYTSPHPGDYYSNIEQSSKLYVKIGVKEFEIEDRLTVTGTVRTAYYYSGQFARKTLLFSRASYQDNPSQNFDDLRNHTIGIVGQMGIKVRKIFSPVGALADNFGHANRLIKVLSSSDLGPIYSYGYAQLVRKVRG